MRNKVIIYIVVFCTLSFFISFIILKLNISEVNKSKTNFIYFTISNLREEENTFPILNKIYDVISLNGNTILATNCGILSIKDGKLKFYKDLFLPPVKKFAEINGNLFFLSKGKLFILKRGKVKFLNTKRDYKFTDFFKYGSSLYILSKNGEILRFFSGKLSKILTLNKSSEKIEKTFNSFYILSNKTFIKINETTKKMKTIKLKSKIRDFFITKDKIFIILNDKILLYTINLNYIKTLFYGRVISDVFEKGENIFFYSSLEGFIVANKREISKKTFKVKLIPFSLSQVKIKDNFLISGIKIFKINPDITKFNIKEINFESKIPNISYVKDILFYKNYIFLLTFRDGILILNKNFKLIKKISDEKIKFVNSFSPFSSEIIAGGDFGIFKIEVEKNFKISKMNELKNVRGNINTILYENSDNQLFLGTSKGLYIYKNGILRGFFVINGLPSNKIYTIKKSREKLFCGTDCGLFILNLKDFNVSKVINSAIFDMDSNWVESIALYKNYIFMGTYGGSLYLYDLGKNLLRKMVKGKFFTTLNSMLVSGKNVYFGTLNGSLYKINLKNFKSFKEKWNYGEIYGIFKWDKKTLISSEGGLINYKF